MPRRAVLASIAALLVLAACGSGGETSPPEAAAETTGVQAPAAPSERPDDADRAAGPSAAAAATGVKLTKIADFEQPIGLMHAPGDRRRVYVIEQNGRIMVVRGGKKLATPFADLRSRIRAGGEEGLLGLAFAPDFATSKRFYVHYSAKADGDTTIVEHRATSPDRAAAGAGRLVLSTPTLESNHNGGQMAFGPDKLLYIGLGDGGGGGDEHGERGNGQNLNTLLGKILRIDPKRSGSKAYSIPSSNPFASRGDARGEIYSYGLRNPWRFSFDRSTGDLAIADVGQDEIEEIDFVRRDKGNGANFGWRPFEGSQRFADGESAPGHVKPVIEKSHDDGWCSITGGYVMRDKRLPASMRGRYVYGDFCLGEIRSAKLAAGKATGDARVAGLPKVSGLSTFGEDADRRVYVVSIEGAVNRIDPK